MCHLQSSLTTVKMFLRVQATGNIFEHIKYWLNANIFTNGFTLVKFAKVALQNCYKMLYLFVALLSVVASVNQARLLHSTSS